MPESLFSPQPPTAELSARTGADGTSAALQPRELSIDTRPDGVRTVVVIRGELGLHVDDELRAALRDALGAAAEGIDLDLSGVGFCDCSALNVLLGVREQAVAEGKTVTIRSVGPGAERLFTLTGTLPLFMPGSENSDGDGEHALGVEVVQLRRAMQTRPTIDLARGVLMATFGLSPQDAWQVLVTVSQHTNTKLHRLAEDLVTAVQGDPLAEAVQHEVAAAVARLPASADQEGESAGD
ncbi:ANTAR domain-containing protein [Streptomyces sp. F001]|uniref:ANTAR domain-containing protein n=1 Tax=Streptomyces sp. F001 TaxID=1510026 RepID=UPI00101E7556|nr:ANTAR domain-containing protein [Streptomyces sp. F001]RZB14110.1 ANTAR domain-containing protein [Streptomyces sp. F001]